MRTEIRGEAWRAERRALRLARQAEMVEFEEQERSVEYKAPKRTNQWVQLLSVLLSVLGTTLLIAAKAILWLLRLTVFFAFQGKSSSTKEEASSQWDGVGIVEEYGNRICLRSLGQKVLAYIVTHDNGDQTLTHGQSTAVIARCQHGKTYGPMGSTISVKGNVLMTLVPKR